MKFKQYHNGSADIIFSEEEIKKINNDKFIHLSDENLRHFGNNLVKIVADWNLRFKDEVKKIESKENQEITTSDKDDK